MVRAKFIVSSKTEIVGGFQVSLMPVISGSKENEQFYKWTPGGSIRIETINQGAADEFLVGKPYYIDFSLAE